MNTPRTSLFTIGLLACCVVALTACGSDDPKSSGTVNSTKIEGIIKQGISDKLAVDMDVKCPTHVKRKKGASFTCTAQGANTDKVAVKARQTADNGNVKWSMNAGKTSTIEQQISARILAERKIKVTMDCPDVVQLGKGRTYTCTAHDATGDQRDILVTQTDDNGQVRWET